MGTRSKAHKRTRKDSIPKGTQTPKLGVGHKIQGDLDWMVLNPPPEISKAIETLNVYRPRASLFRLLKSISSSVAKQFPLQRIEAQISVLGGIRDFIEESGLELADTFLPSMQAAAEAHPIPLSSRIKEHWVEDLPEEYRIPLEYCPWLEEDLANYRVKVDEVFELMSEMASYMEEMAHDI